MDHRFRILFVAVMLLLGGCETVPRGRADLLGFITDGKTTRETVLLKLGDPIASYEAGRIVVYRLAKDDGGYFRVDPGLWWPSGARHDVVLVFDSGGVLQKHSLMQVTSP